MEWIENISFKQLAEDIDNNTFGDTEAAENIFDKDLF